MKTPGKLSILVAGALIVAACGSSSETSSPTAGAKVTRGTVTAKAPDASSITVNGVQLATGGTAVRVDDNPGGLDDVRVGDVVTVKGTFDDRLGGAAEIEVHHGVEGMVDDKGVDFIVVGGQRVQVDDTTHFDDRLGARLDSVVVGATIVMVSGAPVAGIPGAVDDQGGLRASRIDRSPRQDDALTSNDHDVDVKGYVSAIDAGAKTFQLRASPDATQFLLVHYPALPAGVVNGSYVEVHSASAPVAGALTATSIHLEDALSGAEVEIEGYVTSISSGAFVNGDRFVAAGVTVSTSASTRYVLGVPADLVVGVKVEAEGAIDSSGVLHASKVSFRPGYRVTGTVASYTGSDLTILGIPVQLPAWLENDLSVALANGAKVEVRGELSADGNGIVAHRLVNPTGNANRVFVRALASSKDAGAQTFTVLGFTVKAASASLHWDSNGDGIQDDYSANRSAFFAAVDPGRTVLKVRANVASDVNVGTKEWIADEVEIEGND